MMGSHEDRSRLPHVTTSVLVQRIPRTGIAPGEVPGQLLAMPTCAAQALRLGTKEAQAAQGFGERGIALSILLADLVLAVSTLTSPASCGAKLPNLLGKAT